MKRILTILGSAALLVLALMFSAALFVVLLVAGSILGAYFWWRTRELRRHMKQRMEQARNQTEMDQGASGVVLEGEVINAEIQRIQLGR